MRVAGSQIQHNFAERRPYPASNLQEPQSQRVRLPGCSLGAGQHFPQGVHQRVPSGMQRQPETVGQRRMTSHHGPAGMRPTVRLVDAFSADAVRQAGITGGVVEIGGRPGVLTAGCPETELLGMLVDEGFSPVFEAVRKFLYRPRVRLERPGNASSVNCQKC